MTGSSTRGRGLSQLSSENGKLVMHDAGLGSAVDLNVRLRPSVNPTSGQASSDAE